MTLEVFYQKDQTVNHDRFIKLHHFFEKDGWGYDTVIHYIPDKGIVNRASVVEKLKEVLQDGDSDSSLNMQANHIFSDFIEAVAPNFVEFTLSVELISPIIKVSAESLSNTIYLSYGDGDWKDYAILRLSQFK